MTKDYLFFLGRDEGLSYAEIISYLRARQLKHELKTLKDKTAVLQIDGFDAGKAIYDLGGTVKIAEEVESLENIYTGSENRVDYSVWDNDGIGLEDDMKKYFKRENIKAISRKPDHMNPTRDSHIDIEVMSFNGKIFKTAAISQPKKYKERDEKRPNYDAKTVISLRLAKILINLSGVRDKGTLLDPFAGLGSIMQEGLLMGMNVIGFESNRVTYEKCKKNLQWIGKSYEKKWSLLHNDSRNLSRYVVKADGAATEPYMGPYYKQLPVRQAAEKLARELEGLYLGVLRELRKVIKGKVVIIIPRFKTKEKKRVEIDFKRILSSSGFEVDNSIPEVTFPVPYFHRMSNVERFIYVLK